MLYVHGDDAVNVTCAVVTDSDISGGCVMTSFWLQSLFLIMFSVYDLEPSEVLLANLSTQVLWTATIGYTVFSSVIDVPNTIIASLFSVMFSVFRVTSRNVSILQLQSNRVLQLTSQIHLLDMVLRLLVVWFNYAAWSSILRLQKNLELCPNGLGKGAIFTTIVDMTVENWASKLAFTYSVLDLAWEVSRYVSEFARAWIIEYRSRCNGASYAALSPQQQLFFDPRIWIVRQMFPFSSPEIESEEDLELTARRVRRRRIMFLLPKFLALIFITVTMENIVIENGLRKQKDESVAQLMALVNSSSLIYVVIARSIWELRRLDLVPQMRQQSFALIFMPVFGCWIYFLWGKANELGQGLAPIWSWVIIVVLVGLGILAGFICLVIILLIGHGIQYLFKYYRLWELLELLLLPFIQLGRNAFGDSEKAEDKERELGRDAEPLLINS
jgi:hypothetical protein